MKTCNLERVKKESDLERESGDLMEPNLPNASISSDQGKSAEKRKKLLGVEFAPLAVPWERRMQTFAVASWILTFFLMGPGSLIFLLYLFFYTQFGFVSLLYFAWYLYDKDQCNQGGRRSEWVRNWKLWKWYCGYFPIRLFKTAHLDPKHNYIFGCHPHGILCSGAFGNFASEGTNFSKIFPGITSHLLTLEGHFSFPFYREYFMCSGACSASRNSVNYLLSRPEGGHAAVLIVGGSEESLESFPGLYTVKLMNRKGFIKTALRQGASLVPVFSFGETDIYTQVRFPEGSRMRSIQNNLRSVLGVAPCLINGRGIFQYTFGIVPQRRPITTVVGNPIHVARISEPTQKDVDELHQSYVDALVKLFDTYHDQFSSPSAKLVVI